MLVGAGAGLSGGIMAVTERWAHQPDRKARSKQRDVRAGGSGSLAREAARPRRDAAHSGVAPASTTNRGWYLAYLRRLVPLDVATALIAGVAGALTRGGEGEFVGYVAAAPLLAFAWVGLLAASEAYGRRRLMNGADQLRAVGHAAIVGVAVVAVIALTLRVAPARTYLIAVVSILVIGSAGARLGVRRWLRRKRARGLLVQRTLIVGRADSVAALVASLRRDAYQGLLPVAVCASGRDGSAVAGEAIDGVPVLGYPDEVLAAADLCEAEVVVVAAHPDLSGPVLRRLTWALEERDVELIVSPGLLDVAGPRLSIRPSSEMPLLHVERPAGNRFHDLAKSVLDRLAAVVLLAVLGPVMLGVALAVRLDDGGPVLFRQKRVGVRGETFMMLKFRTMVPDAESRLEALLAASQFDGVLFKMTRDPRVTRVGALLRRYSLDELPQLLNVLRGDMSLVGPRPPLPREVDQYEPDALRRLRVRPGMTGLWQVSGRSDLSWEQSLRLDLHYVDNWSPLGDLHILIRTVSAVFRGSGAY